MSAFDDMERQDIEPAGRLIGAFDYLNASARPEAQRVRDVVDDMLRGYPAENQTDLVRRIRSRDDGLHRSAMFELVLHETLLRQGFHVVEVEPTVANGRSPDFLVQSCDDQRFYLEATLAMGAAGADPGADRRKRQALQTIDSVASPDFFLSVHPHGSPASQVPTGRLRRRIQRFVDELDYDGAVVAFEAGQPLPNLTYAHDGLCVRIEAVPKRVRGRIGRAIGHQMLPGGLVTPHEAIRSAIEGKASRYGQLGLPYVVAVNAMEEFAREESAVDAAFGTEAVAFNRDGRHRCTRNRDGVWYGVNGPQHTRVSAILSTERLSPWSLGQRRLRIIINPWAAHILPEAGWTVDRLRVENARLVTQSGLSIRQMLGLPEGWPE